MLKKLTRFAKACSIKQTNKQTYYYGRRFSYLLESLSYLECGVNGTI